MRNKIQKIVVQAVAGTKELTEAIDELCVLSDVINWVRPTEKLPEDYDVVLVYLSNGRVRGEEFVSGEFIDSSVAGLDVVAWAELPKAPCL